jgi:hypothetical protein
MKKIVIDFFEAGFGGGILILLIFIGLAIWS